MNDSISIDCRIISIDSKIIHFENHFTLKTETVFADTIKGFVYQGKTYSNSDKSKKLFFNSYLDPNTENAFIRLSFLIPGFSFENKITQSITINTEIGTGYAQGKNTSDGFNEVIIFYNNPENKRHLDLFYQYENYSTLYPFFKFEIRQFYNLLYRQNHSRSTQNYSANYFSLYSLVYLDDLYFIGPTWGLQRNRNKFFFNLNLGGGMYFSSKGNRFQPLIDFKLGILLNKSG